MPRAVLVVAAIRRPVAVTAVGRRYCGGNRSTVAARIGLSLGSDRGMACLRRLVARSVGVGTDD
jgi:hypothetical protein